MLVKNHDFFIHDSPGGGKRLHTTEPDHGLLGSVNVFCKKSYIQARNRQTDGRKTGLNSGAFTACTRDAC